MEHQEKKQKRIDFVKSVFFIGIAVFGGILIICGIIPAVSAIHAKATHTLHKTGTVVNCESYTVTDDNDGGTVKERYNIEISVTDENGYDTVFTAKNQWVKRGTGSTVDVMCLPDGSDPRLSNIYSDLFSGKIPFGVGLFLLWFGIGCFRKHREEMALR